MTNIEDYMKDKEFFKWNPFLKGYIYGEERKKPIQWSNENFYNNKFRKIQHLQCCV